MAGTSIDFGFFPFQNIAPYMVTFSCRSESYSSTIISNYRDKINVISAPPLPPVVGTFKLKIKR